MDGEIVISCGELPAEDRPFAEFRDTTFFRIHGPTRNLPTPEEVRAKASGRWQGGRPPPIVFQDLVKFGHHVTTAEAKCLLLIKKYLKDQVPVPEVYGWRTESDGVFIYMQHMEGVELRRRWGEFSDAERLDVCLQLRNIMLALRRFKQDPHDVFIGTIDRRPLPFIGFDGQPQAGPFSSVSKFRDYICRLPCRNLDEGWRAYDYLRPLIPDTGSIVFTHSDIHQANILISAIGPPRILAIVDWEQSGWYPDYWEYCRACFISGPWEKWRDNWIPKFLEPQPDIYPDYCELLMSFGGF